MRIYGKYEKVKANFPRKFRQQHGFHTQPMDPKGGSMTYWYDPYRAVWLHRCGLPLFVLPQALVLVLPHRNK